MSKRQRNGDSAALTVDLGVGLFGAAAAAPQAAATDAAVAGMNVFLRAAEARLQVIPQILQGNLFEYIEATKFNTDAARKSSELVAEVTAANGAPHAPADILIRKGDQIIQEVQAKSSRTPADYRYRLSDEKYEGMGRLVPSDHEPKVRQLADDWEKTGTSRADQYSDVREHLTSELRAENVSSGGTTYSENIFAAENPRLYAAIFEAKAVAREAGKAGAAGAAAGFVIGGAISAIKNGIAAARGDMDGREAIKVSAIDAAKAGVRGGATGVGGAIIRYAATKANIKFLSDLGPATAMAAGTISVGITAYAFAHGEITPNEAIEQLVQHGISTLWGIYGAEVTKLALGPAAGALGPMVGVLLAVSIYQSCNAILKQAKLVEEQAAKLIALSEVAIAELTEQCREFEEALQAEVQLRREDFAVCLAAIDTGMRDGNSDVTADALADLAALFGRKLKLQRFAGFDEFMTDDERPLVI